MNRSGHSIEINSNTTLDYTFTCTLEFWFEDVMCKFGIRGSLLLRQTDGRRAATLGNRRAGNTIQYVYYRSWEKLLKEDVDRYLNLIAESIVVHPSIYGIENHIMSSSSSSSSTTDAKATSGPPLPLLRFGIIGTGCIGQEHIRNLILLTWDAWSRNECVIQITALCDQHALSLEA